MITPWQWDLSLLQWLNFDGGTTLDTLMWWISGKLTWVPLYLLFFWFMIKRWGVKWAFLWLALAGVMILFTDQTCTYAKNNFPKFRPTHYPELQGALHTVRGYVGGLYGTISSHAANSVAFALFAALSLRLGGMTPMRWIYWGLGVWVVLVCYSRIYLGAHYPMDLFLGVLCGTFWGFGFFVLFKRLMEMIQNAYDKSNSDKDL